MNRNRKPVASSRPPRAESTAFRDSMVPRARLWVTPPLERMSPHGLAVWLEAYGLGYAHGVAAAHDQAERDAFGFLRVVGGMARAAARGVPEADRLDRVGEHRRAERQRALLRRRGVTDRYGRALPEVDSR